MLQKNWEIKKEYKLELEKYIGQIFDKDKVIEESLLMTIGKISYAIDKEIVVLINRKGQVVDIELGDDHSAIVPAINTKDRLSGIRLIHTHPNTSCTLSSLDLSCLHRNLLDCIIAISVDKLGVNQAEVAFIHGEGEERMKVDDARFLNKYGIMEKLYYYDQLYKDSVDRFTYQEEAESRAVLVGVELGKDDIVKSLEELKSLAETNHIETVDILWQKRAKPDAKYFIGEGKVEEIKQSVQNHRADIVIFDNELSGSKQNALETYLGVKVIDRSRLILDIFAGRARTSEGKLQVELAQLKYTLPRLSGIVGTSGRFGGGVGMRGPGETKLELDRRVIEKNIQKKTLELAKVKKQRELTRSQRQKNQKITVAIVGYTNSGKSTLLNLLTKANVYAKDELFATLDTTTRQFYIDKDHEILLVDTVGFIHKLPHEFIDAFSSTLEETVYADVLLHVMDLSNPDQQKQEEVVLNVLRSIGAKAPIIRIFNKIDKVKEYEKQKDAIYISAKNGTGIDQLKEKIVTSIDALHFYQNTSKK